MTARKNTRKEKPMDFATWATIHKDTLLELYRDYVIETRDVEMTLGGFVQGLYLETKHYQVNNAAK
jgi:hypothetical protein